MRLIVTRHPAAAEFIRAARPEFESAKVLESATADDVRDRVVAGNLPLHLAALAGLVVAVEFDGAPPRGAELTLEDMRAAGARLTEYVVLPSNEYDQLCQLADTNPRGHVTPPVS